MASFDLLYKRIAFLLLASVSLLLGLLVVSPFVPAILWATVLSVLLFPVYDRWQKSLETKRFMNKGRSEPTAAFLTTLVALVIIVIPFLMIGGGIYGQVQQIADEIGGQTATGQHKLSVDAVLHYVDNMAHPLAERLGAGNFSVVNYVQENRRQIVDNLRQPVTRAASQVVFTIVTLVIALLTMFFMLKDSKEALDPALDLIPLPRDKGLTIMHRVAETIRAVFVGTVLVAIIQGTIMGITYFALGVPNSLLLGVFSVMLCIIPLLGAPVLYIPIGVLFLAQGDVTSGLVILGVGGLIVSQIDNVLKPFLIAGRVNLHPMAIFFSILGGVILVGPIGVMAGPMLLTVILSLVDVVRERLHMAPRPEA